MNLSSQFHPMHLHGFYFQAESLGDGVRDTAIAAEQRQRVVTQLMPPGGTMAMTWQAERVGNWLFHCHTVDHVSPKRRLAEGSTEGDHSSPHRAHAGHNASAGMAAMVLGVTVIDSSSTDSRERIDPPARAIALAMRHTGTFR